MSSTFNHYTKDPSSSKENLAKFNKNDDYNPRNKVMADHKGIVICRNGRKIFMQNHLPDIDIGNNYRQVGMELDFDGSLDEILGLTTQKDKVRFGKEFFNFLREKGFIETIRYLF